jgi:hypothetical protein
MLLDGLTTASLPTETSWFEPQRAVLATTTFTRKAIGMVVRCDPTARTAERPRVPIPARQRVERLAVDPVSSSIPNRAVACLAHAAM